jgi:hypothetical protein
MQRKSQPVGTATTTISMPKQTLTQARKQARAAGLSLSAWVRTLMLRAMGSAQ